MGLDALFLTKLKDELKNKLETGKISKIYQFNKTDFLFDIRCFKNNYSLHLSVDPTYPKLYLTSEKFDKPYAPPGFCMLLRKYLESGTIEEISLLNNDRIVAFKISKINELEDTSYKYLIVELFGRRSNLILLDDDMTILDCIKHLSPFESTRTITTGAKYTYPDQDKIPFNDYEQIKNIDLNNMTEQYLFDHISGLSKPFISYIVKNYQLTNSFIDYYQSLINKYQPSISSDFKDFYYFDVFNSSLYFSNLNEMLDRFYLEITKRSLISKAYQPVYTVVKRNYDHLNKKLLKINSDINQAQNYDELRVMGELLISNINAPSNSRAISVFNYYTNQDIEIIIDQSLSIKQNANKYFKKYKKLKISLEYLAKEKAKCENEKRYFESLLSQLEKASLNDVLEMEIELINLGYMPKKVKKQKIIKLNYDVYQNDEGVLFYVGKNNMQNDFLTNKFAKPFDMWFHIKNAPGSHVILRGELNEKSIRQAANLAALFSSYSSSTSVAVDYTEVKNIKKIPGQLGCFVTYSTNKTIYIDPDISLVNNDLKKGK